MSTLLFGARRAITRQLRAEASTIADAMTDEFLARHPEWLERYGELARIRGLEDAHFHIEFLIGALLAGEPASFARYATWTAGVLGSRGIDSTFLIENLEQLRDHAARPLYPEGAAEVGLIVEAGIAAVREHGLAPEAEAGEGQPGERALYLQAALAGDRTAALGIAVEALRAGTSVHDVYQHMVQPAQYEIGKLWANNTISVASEHAATAVTQYVIARLHEHFPAPDVRHGNAIVTGVRNEVHQLGATMIADVLESDGWNVRFLGSRLPHRDVVTAAAEHDARIVCISVALLSHLEAACDLIDDLRAAFASRIGILVGGNAFRFEETAWRDIGADGIGRDLAEARELGRRFVAG